MATRVEVDKAKNLYASFTVTGVTITDDASVAAYKTANKSGKKAAFVGWLDEVLAGIKKKEGWGASFKIDPTKKPPTITVNGFNYPMIDGHKGHVEGKGWKYYIERGKQTVDRYVVEETRATVKYLKTETVDKVKPPLTVIHIEVSVTAKAKVLVSTH